MPPDTYRTNASFAKAIGVNFTTVSKYRHGIRVPSTRVALRIAKYYELDVVEMLEAISRGAEEFGRYIRINVFGAESIDLISSSEDLTNRQDSE